MPYSVDRLIRESKSSWEPAVPPGQAIADPLQHLLDCHERIEERLQILERATPHLSSAAEEQRQPACEAFEKALRFLEQMGRLHTLDEEETLFPRLRASETARGLGLDDLSAALEAQHRDKEGVLEKVRALAGELFAANAGAAAPAADRLSRLDGYVAQLAGLYRPHMMLENARLIPLSRESLHAADLEAMAQEMRDRRSSPRQE